MCLSLETLTSIIRTGLPIPVELIDLVNSVIIFLSETNFLRWLTFLLDPILWLSQSALLDLFLFSDVSILSAIAVLPLGNSDHVVFSVSIGFPSNSQLDAPSHCIAYDYSCAGWDGLCEHLRDVPCKDVSKLDAAAFCLYPQNKSLESKVKFRQASNQCKSILETAKLAYANKTKESITSQKRGPYFFC